MPNHRHSHVLHQYHRHRACYAAIIFLLVILAILALANHCYVFGVNTLPFIGAFINFWLADRADCIKQNPYNANRYFIVGIICGLIGFGISVYLFLSGSYPAL